MKLFATSALAGGMAAILLLTLINLSGCQGDADVIDTVATPISQVVDRIKIAEEYYNRKVQLKTKVFYRAHEYKRAWLSKRKPEKIFKAFVDEVKESTRYGFAPDDYQIDALEKAVDSLFDNRKRTASDLSSLDIRITASFFLFTTHLLEGRVRYPGAREFLWQRGMPLENDIALLLKMGSASHLRKELEDLHPKDPQYKRLQRALKEYRELAKADSFPPLPEALTLKPGGVNTAIPLLRKKLRLTDHIARGNDTLTRYDDDLVKAVREFQERHGLEASGRINAETVRFLNVSMENKADVIALNLERLRWLPHLQGKEEEIVINVPEYVLRVYHNGREKMKMRVVLGTQYTPTPVFHDTLKYIVFSPTWSVPKSIFEKEFLPRLQDDPAVFNPERFRFYRDGKEVDPLSEQWNDEDLDTNSYKVVENPGEENSLGSVKFIMPNDFSIYLHDTPADKLFKRDERALSHGCIRLEKPAEFAEYLLSDQKGWNREKIEDAMYNNTKPLQVDLTRPYPVYIVYRTTWVDEDGNINFRDDVYGHDQRHLAHLTK
ncbi:MAG: L,D-transpeptidase family protein [Bacteroidota bacterium]|nr:L,D-transpeptidase family protein [Bacteroidota bacterium]